MTFLSRTLGISCLVAMLPGTMLSADPRHVTVRGDESRYTPLELSVSYPGCREARAAGVTPIRQGQPGYRTWMDGDNDGIACDDYGRNANDLRSPGRPRAR